MTNKVEWKLFGDVEPGKVVWLYGQPWMKLPKTDDHNNTAVSVRSIGRIRLGDDMKVLVGPWDEARKVSKESTGAATSMWAREKAYGY